MNASCDFFLCHRRIPHFSILCVKYGIKPLLYWSVCGNELRVYSTESLGSHACRDANTLPTQATFSFWSESEPFALDSPPGALSSQYSVNPSSVSGSSPPRVFDHFPRPGSAMASTGRKRLAVRAVSSVEIGDGRRILVCLVSEHGVESEVRSVTGLNRINGIKSSCIEKTDGIYYSY